MATEAKIKRALSPEEWREFLHLERKTPKPADQIAAYMDASGASEEEARQAFLHDAAVNLHLAGPVFTREHVRELRSFAWEEEARGHMGDPGPLHSIADIIEALLPPEE